ncbi:MAG: shikimate kinase [Chloroflexota bacterium]|nr:MAG: shikimate kinase [Chloroflexota bacterium]
MSRNIVLVGISGSGKSTIGRALAARLGRRFVDTDEVIMSRFGMPIGDVFSSLGESVFREAESEAVVAACAGDDQVVSLGGGAIVKDESFTVAQDGNLLVRLSVSAEEAVRRLTSSPGTEERPMLRGGDPIARLADMLAAREARYAQADITIDTERRGVNEIVSVIVAAARDRGMA